MSNLMDERLDRLHFAHPFVNRNALIDQVVIAVCAAFDFLKLNGNGRDFFQGAPEVFVLLNTSGQLSNHDVRNLFAVRLRDIENTNDLEGRTQNLHSLRDGLTVCIQHRLLRGRINLLHLHCCLIGRGSKDFDTFLAFQDMTVKIALPRGISGNEGSVRFLHGDKKCIVERVVVKLGHRAKVFLETLGFKEFLDAPFQFICDFTDLLGIFVFSHFRPPYFSNSILKLT